MSISSIIEVVDKYSDAVERSLENRLEEINKEIQRLRNQQKVIIRIIQKSGTEKESRVITKDTWVSILSAKGLDEEGMWNWHKEFERTSPEAHRDFLESLGIENEEIEYILKKSIKIIQQG